MVEINLSSNAVILGIKDNEHPFNAYRKYKVPMAFSTDDEGVSRIDLTREYQRAVDTYNLSYADLKYYSRNALAYSFLAGNSLFVSTGSGQLVGQCASSSPDRDTPDRQCGKFLASSEKATWQWNLEQRFSDFEAGYQLD